MNKRVGLTFIAFFLFISLFLSACGEAEKEAIAIKKEITELSDKNKNSFVKRFTKEYSVTLNDLIASFDKARKSGKHYDFIRYRNHTWTPAYKKRKDHYQTVLEKNQAYILDNELSSLFKKFDSMIYIGIYLKNGLLNDDLKKIDKAFATAKKDHRVVKEYTTAAR